MIDHLLGRPSTRLKRVQVLFVLAFWGWILRTGPRDGPGRLPLVRRANRYGKRFTPWQIFVFSLTSVYAIRHLDALAGFGAPEPLARMYSRSYYRVTWINTALEAGFASAMSVRPIWLRDILSFLFSFYYVIYANEADEKLRRYRAFCTIDFLRTTWNKTTNPYIRAFTWIHRPRVPVAEQILLPRPSVGPHNKRPIRAWLFYCKPLRYLREEDELIIDFVGGGFVSMDPRHHEERLRQTAKEVKRPVLAVDYCKAPEYPYPYALEECYDLYRSLFESRGTILGMSGRSTFRVILTGDSAGGNLAAGVMLKILEYPQPHIKSAYAAKAAGGPGSAPPALPRPIALVLNYPALNFAFTSWMKPDHLNVLRSQSEVNLQSVLPMRKGSKRRDSVGTDIHSHQRGESRSSARSKVINKSYTSLANQAELHLAERARMAEVDPSSPPSDSPETMPERGWVGRIESDDVIKQASSLNPRQFEEDQRRAAQQRVLQEATEKMDSELSEKHSRSATVNTRLTLTSMAGYFQDRIMTQSMMRAMAILYIGPRRQPDFDNDYFLSPIVAPAKYLADFPPVLFTCGEKDPICDDTVVMAGRIRQAKLARQMAVKRRGTRFGEQLRMSGSATVEEDEDVDDWVQMRIIEGWSHGYLQMSSLLPEAKRVISYLSSWMTDAFDDYNERVLLPEQQRSGQHPSPPIAVTSPKGNGNVNAPPAQSPVAKRPQLGVLQPRLSSSDEDEDDEPLSFTPKSRRSPSLQSQESNRPGSQSGSPRSPAPRMPPSVAKIQAQANRNRPSSFSTGDHSGMMDASSLLLPPPAVPARRRRSIDHPHQPSHGEGSLVKESSLLERRRMDAISYIGGSANASKSPSVHGASAIESSDSE